jgi:hypothetical protein
MSNGLPDPGAPMRPAAGPAARRRRRWPLVLLVFVVAGAGLMLALWHGLSALDSMPINVSIDGERIVTGYDLASLPPLHKLVIVAAAVFALTAVLVVVPLAVLMALAGVTVGLLLAIGLPLLVVAAVLGLLLSPLILLVWLLWRLLRSSPPGAPA